MDEKNISTIDRFDIKKASNGFIVTIEYHPVPETGRTWAPSEMTTVIALTAEEIKNLVVDWFGRVA